MKMPDANAHTKIDQDEEPKCPKCGHRLNLTCHTASCSNPACDFYEEDEY